MKFIDAIKRWRHKKGLSIFIPGQTDIRARVGNKRNRMQAIKREFRQQT